LTGARAAQSHCYASRKAGAKEWKFIEFEKLKLLIPAMKGSSSNRCASMSGNRLIKLV
jgi:hypothetical protein